MRRFQLNQNYWFFLLILFTAIIYWPLINVSSPVNPDAQYVFLILKSSQNLSGYLYNLLNLKTLDFQPVRDLSLFIDLKIYDIWQLNISVLHNMIIWIICNLVLGKIIQSIFPEVSKSEVFFIQAGFLVYPLFTQTVCWGIARKHLLSFLFILLATHKWIKNDKEFSFKDILYFTTFFCLSVLSQPITLLWPIWALIYASVYKINRFKDYFIWLIPAFLVLICVGTINTLYYESSPIFVSIYGSKTDEIFSFGDKILSFGHYLFQLTYHYLLAFTYTLAHWSSLAGLGILGLILILLIYFKINRKFAFVWMMFGLLPLLIVMTKSKTLYDTYLLLPATGLLIISLAIKEKLPTFRFKYLFYSLGILTWILLSHNETLGWKDEILLTQRSFQRRPSCLTAFHYLRMSYENASPPNSPEAKQYIYRNTCEDFEVSGKQRINLQAYLLFYEEDFPLEERLNKLKNISGFGLLPTMALASAYLKYNKKKEADKTIELMIKEWGNKNYRSEFIPFAHNQLYPYCVNIANFRCMRMLKPFLTKKNNLMYK